MEIEYAREAARVDHVRILLEVGWGVELSAALNTLSRRNRDAGFEPRIRVGIVRSVYETIPHVGVFDTGPLDYGTLEQEHNIFYEYKTQEEMEVLFAERTKRAVMAEVWGDIYARNHFGIHQIHSRRTSCAVADDIKDRDGALKFYYEHEHEAELLLFKFCGQP